MPITKKDKDEVLTTITTAELVLKDFEDRLRDYVPADVAELLNHRDEDGNTALHLACRVGNFELVRILLGHKALTNLKNSAGLLPVECVAADDAGAEIAALITVINKRREVIKVAHIDWDRTSLLIEQAQKHIQSHVFSGKSPVIILGNTRKGKSTFINYLLRESNYRIVEVDGADTAQPEGDPLEPARVGRTMLSETLYPSQYELPGKDYTVMDMPGFKHNVGSPDGGPNPYDISAGFTTAFFLERFVAIRATALVIEWGDLLNHNIDAILEPLKLFAAMMGNTDAVLANSLLVITKPNLEAKMPTTERIEGALRRYKREIQIAMGKSGCDPVLMAKIDQVLQEWLKSPGEHVFVGDIRTNACRDAIHGKLSSLHPVAREHFQFQDYSAEVRHFNELVAELAKVTESLEADSKTVSEKLEQCEKRRLAVSDQVDELTACLILEDEASVMSLASSIEELEHLVAPTQELRDEAYKINLQVRVSQSLMPDWGGERAVGFGAAPAGAGAGAGGYASGLFGARAGGVPVAAAGAGLPARAGMMGGAFAISKGS